MTEIDPNVVKSPLCRKITAEGITVSVEIYCLDDREGWALELVEEDWTSTVWDDVFPTDQAAWDYFQSALQREGLKKILETDQDEPLH